MKTVLSGILSGIRKTGVNALGPNPVVIGIKTVAGSGVELTVIVNGPKNCIRVTVCVTATERLWDPDLGLKGQAKNSFLHTRSGSSTCS